MKDLTQAEQGVFWENVGLFLREKKAADLRVYEAIRKWASECFEGSLVEIAGFGL